LFGRDGGVVLELVEGPLQHVLRVDLLHTQQVQNHVVGQMEGTVQRVRLTLHIQAHVPKIQIQSKYKPINIPFAPPPKKNKNKTTTTTTIYVYSYIHCRDVHSASIMILNFSLLIG